MIQCELVDKRPGLLAVSAPGRIYCFMARPDGLLRGLRPLGLADARLALRAINLACGQVIEPACCLSGVRIEDVERHLAAKRYSIRKSVARPERLLRSLRPLGLADAWLALRTINLA